MNSVGMTPIFIYAPKRCTEQREGALCLIFGLKFFTVDTFVKSETHRQQQSTQLHFLLFFRCFLLTIGLVFSRWNTSSEAVGRLTCTHLELLSVLHVYVTVLLPSRLFTPYPKRLRRGCQSQEFIITPQLHFMSNISDGKSPTNAQSMNACPIFSLYRSSSLPTNTFIQCKLLLQPNSQSSCTRAKPLENFPRVSHSQPLLDAKTAQSHIFHREIANEVHASNAVSFVTQWSIHRFSQ